MLRRRDAPRPEWEEEEMLEGLIQDYQLTLRRGAIGIEPGQCFRFAGVPALYRKACSPVIAFPRIKVCTSLVPS